MKKLFFILLAGLTLLASQEVCAQKFGYVDTEKILSKVPEYVAAQKKVDEVAKGWQEEIAKKYKEIDDLYRDYQAQQVLLTEEMKKKSEEQITGREKSVKDLQKQRFGASGDLFKKREELVKPIQEKVFNAITKVAKTKGVDFIFDKSSGTTMLYSDEKFDYSNEVLKSLGL